MTLKRLALHLIWFVLAAAITGGVIAIGMLFARVGE
jgi:uncharacterized integral membrane protein